MPATQPPPDAPGVDAHGHLDDPRFDADRRDVLAAARAVGVGAVVLAASDPARWETLRAIAATFGLPFAIGVHPWWPDDDAITRLPSQLAGAVAIGETGLDYHRARSAADRAAQRRRFDAHLALAAEHDLPVVLHAVRALPDVLAGLRAFGVRRGQIHAFTTGDVDAALAHGMHLSFGPDLTRYPAVLARALATPPDRRLFESDAPARPLLGDRGEPAHVAAITSAFARAADADPGETLAVAGDATRALFGFAQVSSPA